MRSWPIKAVLAGAMAAGVGATLTGFGAWAGWCPFAAVWPVAVSCAVIAAALQAGRSGILDQLDNRTRTLRNRLEDMRRDVGDIHGLVRLQPYAQALPLPMGGGWALTGDSAAILVREVLLRRTETIVELGSGVSTLLLGQVLQRRGKGRLLSLDHDPVWAERTRDNVRQMGLQDHVTVLHVPLVPVVVAGTTYAWYDLPATALDELGPVDLLLVDGPPQLQQQALGARFPALPLLGERLSERGWVFVDDAGRAAETAMVDRWMRDCPEWSAERYATVDGVCLMSRRVHAA